MKYLIFCLIPFSAMSEVVVEYHKGNPFATVTLHNREEYGTEYKFEVLIDTDEGVVVFEHEITPNYPSDKPDYLRVINAPSGVVAVPAEIEVDERAYGEIKLYYWEGM